MTGDCVTHGTLVDRTCPARRSSWKCGAGGWTATSFPRRDIPNHSRGTPAVLVAIARIPPSPTPPPDPDVIYARTVESCRQFGIEPPSREHVERLIGERNRLILTGDSDAAPLRSSKHTRPRSLNLSWGRLEGLPSIPAGCAGRRCQLVAICQQPGRAKGAR